MDEKQKSVGKMHIDPSKTNAESLEIKNEKTENKDASPEFNYGNELK